MSTVMESRRNAEDKAFHMLICSQVIAVPIQVESECFFTTKSCGPLFGSSDREQKSGLANLHGSGAWSRPVEESRPPPEIQNSKQPDCEIKITNHVGRRSTDIPCESAKLGCTVEPSWPKSSTKPNFRCRDCGKGERIQGNSRTRRNHKSRPS